MKEIEEEYEILVEEWKKDSKINSVNLDRESLKIPELHSKYYNAYMNFMKWKKETKSEYSNLLSKKTRWLMGEMDLSEMKELGWEPCPKKHTKYTFQTALDEDKELRNLSLTIGRLDDITEFLKSVIDAVVKRNFSISNAIAWRKFQQGVI